MVFADFSGQVAFRKAAAWLFGGLAMGLQPCREQLGCQVGFKLGLEGPSCAQVGRSWPQDGPKRLPKIILQDFLVDCRAFLGRAARACACVRAYWQKAQDSPKMTQ